MEFSVFNCHHVQTSLNLTIKLFSHANSASFSFESLRLQARAVAVMSLEDFSQDAQDHAHLFVYVTPLGETSGALYAAVLDSLQNLPPIHPHGSKDSLIFVRFVSRIPRWARDGRPWKEFQPFKQVLGLLAITQCHDGDDVAVAEETFRGACSPFAKSLCDAKCVVYGSKSELDKAILCRKDFLLVEFDNSQSFSTSHAKIDVSRLEKVVTDFAGTIFVKLQQRIKDLKAKMDTGKMDLLRSPVDGKESESEEEGR